jgi:Predicted nucleotidyltransferases
MKEKDYILDSIKETLKHVMPPDAKVILFGSQAQGNAHVNSDWDILILLNKIKIEHTDFDNVAYPLMELGWNIGAEINPILYTHEDWKKRNFTPFYKNVMQQGIELWH